MMLILKNGEEIAQNYGFGSALATLCKGLAKIGAHYTFDAAAHFDIIVANDFMNAARAVELKKKTGKPIIMSIHLAHGNMPEEKLLLDNCDGIIVYSLASKEFIVKVYPEITVPIEVVQLGIDTDLWNYQEKSESTGNLLFVGRTKAVNKNFIELMKKIIAEEIPFKVAGDNPDLPGISLGYLDKEKLKQEYQRAHLHILPSTYEPYGLVSLEAMACGCPVAVSTRSGVSEILNENVAILFDPLEKYSLTDLMNRAQRFNPSAISAYAMQFTAEAHARDFVASVSRLRHFAAITNELACGVYDKFDVSGLEVVDIGAYMGESAQYFVKRGAAKVYAVEPFESIKYIARTDKIEPIRKAVSKHKIPYFFAANGYKNDGESCLSRHMVNMGDCTLIPVLDLATLPVSDALLKVDCEGDEDFILELSPEVLHRYRYMMIEAHDSIKPGMGFELAAFLTKNGFKVQLEKRTPTETMIYAES